MHKHVLVTFDGTTVVEGVAHPRGCSCDADILHAIRVGVGALRRGVIHVMKITTIGAAPIVVTAGDNVADEVVCNVVKTFLD